MKRSFDVNNLAVFQSIFKDKRKNHPRMKQRTYTSRIVIRTSDSFMGDWEGIEALSKTNNWEAKKDYV